MTKKSGKTKKLAAMAFAGGVLAAGTAQGGDRFGDAFGIFGLNPKPVLILDLGHNARYAGACKLDRGVTNAALDEVDVIDALGERLVRDFAGEKAFETRLTRAPGQELAGGCVDRRVSLLSRLEHVQAAAREGRAVLFVSLHVNSTSAATPDDVLVFTGKGKDVDRRLAEKFAAKTVTAKTEMREDDRDLLLLGHETQTARAVLLEIGDIANGSVMTQKTYLDRMALGLAAGIRAAVAGLDGTPALVADMESVRDAPKTTPKPPVRKEAKAGALPFDLAMALRGTF